MTRGVGWGAAISSVILAAAPAHASPNPSSLWIAISAEYHSSPVLREWGGFLAVSIPFDRLAAPRMPLGVPAVSAVPLGAPRLTEDPQKKQTEATPPTAPSLPKKPEPVLLLLTPRLARSTVRHALANAGYFDWRVRLRSLSGRARSSASLPELRLRALHSTGETLRLTPTTDDPYRYTQAGTSQLAFEARLTWHLDRLVFADQEVSIERLQTERDAAERHLIDHVLSRLALWQRSRVRAADVDSEPEVRETAELEAVGAAVELDVLTDGWFSQAIGESEGEGSAPAGEPVKVEVDTPRHAR
ncbi:MAG: hypothetical protein ABI488_22565 [Polyangiaceae bacterium]